MNLARMSDKKLIAEIKGLHDSIYNLDCFGADDVLLYEKISRELGRRGYCQAWNEIWVRRSSHARETSPLLSQTHETRSMRRIAVLLHPERRQNNE